MTLATTDVIMDAGNIGQQSSSKGIRNTESGSLDTSQE